MLNAPSALDDARTSVRVLEPSPSPVLLVLGGILISAGLLVLPWWFGAIGAFRYLFLIVALSIGLVFYRAFPVLYVGYTWWLLFLTPLVRRIVDYQIGWQDANLVMQALNLVLGLSFFTLLRNRHRLLDKVYFPFALILVALAYGYAVGLMNYGLVKATRAFMEWAFPLFFGFHVVYYWREFPALRRCIQRTFLWGIAAMGTYGVVQFVVLPPWDSFWMEHFNTLTFWGHPRPFQLRVFSTMSDYLLFGKVAMAGLLVLFSLATWKHLIAAVPGYAAFLLTASRTAWGAWLVALVLMALWIKGRMRMRLLGTLLLGTLVLLPLLAMPQAATLISDRLQTFENLEEDGSFIARQRLYREYALPALTDPIGSGFGADYVLYDSGLLMTPYLLGWPGLMLFTISLLLLIRAIWKGRRTDDLFTVISTAIVMAFLAMLPFATPFIGAAGAAFWCFVGLSLAGYRYYSTQERDEDTAPLEPTAVPERP